MIVNKATAYSAVNGVLAQIREEAGTYQRSTVSNKNLLPGDVLVDNGETVRQIFDHVFGDLELPARGVLVQFTQVTGLSFIPSGMVEIFRPVHRAN